MAETVYERLLEEFAAAIPAVLGDESDKEFKEGKISRDTLKAIANKVAFYLDL